VGTYTVNNSLPGGNLMVYSGGLPITDASTSVLNENVNLVAYKAAVPVQGYSLPVIYSGHVRLGFKAAAAAVQNSLGKAEPAQPPEKAGRLRVGDTQRASKTEPVANSTPGHANPGRLGVGQIHKPKSKSEVGSAETPEAKPMVRAGNVSLRMSEEFYPFELAEVAIGGAKLSQNR